jgi:hypothetical protein
MLLATDRFISSCSDCKQSYEGFCINESHHKLQFLRNHTVNVQHCTVPEQRELQPDKEFSAIFNGGNKLHTLKGLGVENVGIVCNQLVSEK